MAGHSIESGARTTSSKKKAGGASQSRSTPGGSSRSTSGKSGGRSGSTNNSGVTAAESARLSRPFDSALWRQAAALAAQYQLVITPEPDVGFFGRTLEMPLVMADGPTIGKCAEQVLEATTAALATLLERGEHPPSPSREGKRDQQLNIRLTAEEKLALEGLAAREGYRSVSDYVRAAALGGGG